MEMMVRCGKIPCRLFKEGRIHENPYIHHHNYLLVVEEVGKTL
jgi:hypothetical protein